jgi:hypothetical protein
MGPLLLHSIPAAATENFQVELMENQASSAGEFCGRVSRLLESGISSDDTGNGAANLGCSPSSLPHITDGCAGTCRTSLPPLITLVKNCCLLSSPPASVKTDRRESVT